MKVKETITELWKSGFFRTHRSVGEVDKKMLKDYGVTCANTIMVLKTCKDFLRKDAKGWVQKKLHPQGHTTATKNNSIEDVLDNRSLWLACISSFQNGEYWDACLHALRHLETKTRQKADLAADDTGIALINKAFNPDNGVLKIPSCATRAEEEGFFAINRGIVMFHRNAKGHREGVIDRKNAIKIICYTDYLLNVLDTAEKRSNK